MSKDLIKSESELTAQDEQRKQEIINAATEFDFLSTIPVDVTAIEGRKQIPFAEIATLGMGFEPLVTGIQTLISQGGSGYYYVNAKGGNLVHFKDSNKLMGSIAQKGTNKVGGGTAELTQINFSPEMVSQCAMAVAMLSIEHRLSNIQQTQDEILEFVEKKDEYMLKGSMYFLLEILSNYKYNINNDRYSEINHKKVLDIKESAEQSILLYSDMVKNITKDKAFLHIDMTVKDKLKKLQGYFKSYQIALYNYAFSSFLDVILLGNFDAEFLDAIISKVDKYSLGFRETYTVAYNKLETYNDSAVDNVVIKNAGKVASKLGDSVGKLKGLDKVADKLDITGKVLTEFTEERKENVMEQVISNRTNYALPFKNAIDYIKKIYNSDFSIVVNNDGIYIDKEIA